MFDGQETVSSESANPSKIEKALKWVIIITLIILGGELVVILMVNPCLPLSKVEVLGMPELNKSMILKTAGITDKSSYIAVNSRIVEKRLKTFWEIESVKVTKRFPDSVRIVLTGRKAIAMSFSMIDGRIDSIFFDKKGLIFMIGSSGQKIPSPLSVPIISGLITEQPFLGMKLPTLFNSLFSNLETIQVSAPELLTAISEIQINRNNFNGYDLILYPIHNRIRIRLGSELNEHILRYVLLVMDVCASRGVKIEEIDFRTGTASYIIKEASSG
jgi:cell division protein FtsQ